MFTFTRPRQVVFYVATFLVYARKFKDRKVEIKQH